MGLLAQRPRRGPALAVHTGGLTGDVSLPHVVAITRRIGLSLGADLCWPICYEEVLTRLDLVLQVGGDTVASR